MDLQNIVKIIVFEPGIKPYLSEINGSLQGFRETIKGKNNDFSEAIKLDFKEIEVENLEKDVLIQMVFSENGISLRMKQNSHTENVMGTFIVVKSEENQFVGLEKQEIKLIIKHFKT